MNLNINSINITSIKLWVDKQDDMHLQDLRTYIIEGWSSNRYDVKQDIQPYWIFQDRLAMIDGIAMKGK